MLRLRETTDALLAKIVTSLAVGLLRIDNVLQYLIFHRGKQPEAFAKDRGKGPAGASTLVEAL